MKLFLHINTKKIETVIPYVDNYLWNVGIQKILLKNYEAIIRNFLFSKNLDASGRIVYKNSYQNPRA